MDAGANAVRSHFSVRQSFENGAAESNAADNEMAARRNWYVDAYNKERDHIAVNNLPPGRLKALKSHISVMHQMDAAITGKPSIFSRRELNTQLEKAMKRYDIYRKLLQHETDYCKTSRTTQAWNFLAGVNGFLLCFGLGTLSANVLGQPWLALVISPLIWSLTERLIPMIRATSWRNRHADVDYPHIMRIAARVVRDWVRRIFGLHNKKYLVNGKTLIASQYRQSLSLFNAWKGKVATDDLPYFFYTFWYSVRSIVLTLCATPAFLKSSAGTAVSLVSLGIAGMLAGASTSLTVQAARRHAHRKENPDTWRNGEIIVKSPEIWRAEKALLESKIKLLKAYEKIGNERGIRDSFMFSQGILSTEMYRAGMKSGRLTSIVYEISCLLQKQSMSGEDGLGEVAGNRIDALCGFLGKSACLVPAILFNHLVAMKYASGHLGLTTTIAISLSLNTLLIMGFSFRKELEFPWRYMLEMVYACLDGIHASLGKKDKYADNDVAAAVEVSVDTDPDSGGEAGNRSESSENDESSAPGLRVKVAPDGASATDGSSSKSS